MTASLADYFRSLPLKERISRWQKLSRTEQRDLLLSWPKFWARPEQLAPTATAKPGTYFRYHDPGIPGQRPTWQPADNLADWTYWVCNAGRGWGKTRTGAEWVRAKIIGTQYVSLIAPTAADVRDVMIEGPSGILWCCSVSSRTDRPKYEPSNRRLLWPNGAISNCFSADEPDRLRGPSHGAIWADELAAWRYPEAWDQAQFGLRLGDRPQACVTTTPKPSEAYRAILADPGAIVSRGTTRDNRHNLAAPFLSAVVGKYVGTRLGRQELDAELLDDNPRALWQRSTIDAGRVSLERVPALVRVVVAIDPMGSNESETAEAGIVVAGLGSDGDAYVLDDLSIHAKPATDADDGWGQVAVRGFRAHLADRIVAEVNFGGDMVEAVIRSIDVNVPYKGVTASRGKAVRAEPVSSLYQQGRVHHVGFFAKLEDELCDWDQTTAKKSPNRLDALVWAITDLQLAPSVTGLLDWMTQQSAPRAQEPGKATAKEHPREPIAPAKTPAFTVKVGSGFMHSED